MPSSRGSSQPRDQIQVSCIAGRFFTVWATRKALLVACYPFSPKNRPFGQMFFSCSERFWAVKITDEYRHFQQCRNIEELSSVAQSCPTLYDPMDCSMPGLPVHCQFLEFTQTHVHWVGDAIQPSHLLSSPSPPAFNLSQHHSLFHWVSSLHQVAKLLEFSFNISSSNEYSGLISFRMHWLDLLAVQGTLKSLLQHHSSKASILWHSAVFIGQLSHPYMTPGKP